MFVELERLLSLRRWLERRPPRRHLAAHRLTSVSPSQAGSKYQHQFILFLWIDPFFPARRDYSQIPLRKRSLHIKYHLEILVYYWNLLNLFESIHFWVPWREVVMSFPAAKWSPRPQKPRRRKRPEMARPRRGRPRRPRRARCQGMGWNGWRYPIDTLIFRIQTYFNVFEWSKMIILRGILRMIEMYNWRYKGKWWSTQRFWRYLWAPYSLTKQCAELGGFLVLVLLKGDPVIQSLLGRWQRLPSRKLSRKRSLRRQSWVF